MFVAHVDVVLFEDDTHSKYKECYLPGEDCTKIMFSVLLFFFLFTCIIKFQCQKFFSI